MFETFLWKYHLPRMVFSFHRATKTLVCRGRPLMYELQFEQPVWWGCQKPRCNRRPRDFRYSVLSIRSKRRARLIRLGECTFDLPGGTWRTRWPSFIALSLSISDRQSATSTQLQFWIHANFRQVRSKERMKCHRGHCEGNGGSAFKRQSNREPRWLGLPLHVFACTASIPCGTFYAFAEEA